MAGNSRKKPKGAIRNTPKGAPAGRSGAPGWVWLLTGGVLAAFGIFLYQLKFGGGAGRIIPLPADKAEVSIHKEANSGTAGETASSGEEHYDFYSLLQTQKAMPNKDAQDAATKAGNAAAALASKKQAAMQASNSGQPTTSLAPTTAPSTATTEPLPATSATPDKTADVTPKPHPASEQKVAMLEKPQNAQPDKKEPAKGRDHASPPEHDAATEAAHDKASDGYYLQAGSFKSEAEADKRRASILILGLPVKTRRVEKDNVSWYRVIVGPMTSKDSLNTARESLQGSGIATAPGGKG